MVGYLWDDVLDEFFGKLCILDTLLSCQSIFHSTLVFFSKMSQKIHLWLFCFYKCLLFNAFLNYHGCQNGNHNPRIHGWISLHNILSSFWVFFLKANSFFSLRNYFSVFQFFHHKVVAFLLDIDPLKWNKYIPLFFSSSSNGHFF